MMADLWQTQREIAGEGVIVCGVDEAGRGPLCGPVCAGAAILPENAVIDGLNDSKKLSEKKREELYDVITDKALAFAVAFSTEAEIDEINILNASLLAMRRAVEKLTVKPDLILVDGNICRGFDIPAKAVVKGDSKCASIAAASILAKVTRDRYMKELSQRYPQYELEKHKGYPTKRHIELLRQYGPADIYRKTFLKKILGEENAR